MSFESKLYRPRFAALALALLLPVSARAQLRPAARDDAPRGYRDGASWVEVTRLGARADGRADVLLQRGPRAFHAVLGRDAIIELAPSASAERVLVKAGVTGVALGKSSTLFRVRSGSKEDGLALAARLAQLPEVLHAMPDVALPRTRSDVAIPPNDEHYSAQWYLERISIERAWRIATGDRDTSIVVVDNGCDMTHPDLAEAFVGGRDVRDEDDDPSPMANTDGNAHGTACAGIIAGVTDNEIGIAGVCPECSLHCVRLLDDSDPPLVPVSADIAAFNYAFDVGAAVVSNSWGFKEAIEVPFLLARTIENVARSGRDGRGTVIVFASGNDNRELNADEITAVQGVITVGAINNFDEAAPFSNRGAQLALTAPTGTFATDISGPDGDESGDYTRSFGGTSAACPVVAGVAALLVSARPELTGDDVARYMIETARPAPYALPDERGHDLTYGYGIVDPERALIAALGLEAEPDAGAEQPVDAGAPDAVPSSGCATATGRAHSSQLPLCVALVVLLARTVAKPRASSRPRRNARRSPSSSRS